MIAALYVEANGVYANLAGVDPWPIDRDARLYNGPHRVIAHPPCERWSSLNNLVLCKYPDRAEEFAHGNDGGCFAAALAAVRRWGGVLEHPAFSRAWNAFGLPRPMPGYWQRGICGGWAAEIDQAAWGHVARKKTWLYAFGTDSLPLLRAAGTFSGRVVRASRTRNQDGSWSRLAVSEAHSEISHRAAKTTPVEFRDLLISIVTNSSSAVAAAREPNNVACSESLHRVPKLGDATCQTIERPTAENFTDKPA